MKRQLLTIGSLWVCSLLFAHPCSSGQEMQWIDHVEKYGLDVQEDKIKELAKKRGVKIARWYVDGG